MNDNLRRGVSTSLLGRLILLALLPAYFVLAEKTDRVILENGDHITGEVKRLEYGKLSFKTDDMGTLSIEWDKIQSVTALVKNFRVELEDGLLFFGTLDTDSATSKLLVAYDTLIVPLNRFEVVRISPIEDTFWERVDISLDLGFSFTKASGVAQLSFNGSFRYLTYWYSRELSVSSVLTDQKDQERTQRHTVNFRLTRFLGQRWIASALTEAQQNSELGLELRLSLGGGVGKNFIQTNDALFQAGAGALVNREWASNSESETYNLESLAGLRLEKFRYDSPQLNLTTTLNIFPSLSDLGRVRLEFDTQLKWEIFKDFFWSLTLYDSYDNKPPNQEAALNDWGTTVSLGWTY
ncbi:MAG: DUF481 domain-containing protein [Calditrichaceae bacterium]|nr:DUF481 domain-containing protein [Calditrichia bacterium]NUQ42053.1 DUF481 domain-containing protein [Calditrichaceae bacterium]